MKKFKFIAICFAAITAMSLMCSCGGKKDKGDDKKADKTEKADMTKKGVKTADVSVNLEDFDATMNYLESNAPSFFPKFNQLMQPVRNALETDVVPTESEGKQLESFINSNQKYFEAVGAILGHEQQGNLSSDQEARLESFSDKYQEGLENVGVLIAIGMAAQGE